MSLTKISNSLETRQTKIDREIAAESRKFRELKREIEERVRELQKTKMNLTRLVRSKRATNAAISKIKSRIIVENARKSKLEKMWRNSVSKSLSNIETKGTKRRRR